MKAHPSVVFYDDNPDFGGHQFMAIRGIAAAAASGKLQAKLVLNPHNKRLLEQAEAIIASGHPLEIVPAPCVTKKFQALRNHYSVQSIRALAQLFDSLNADLIVCLQGEIEDSSLALLAAKRSGKRLMSYIPVAHTMQLMGAKLGLLRDQTTGYLFKVPDVWMTISESIARMLKKRGVKNPIHIVENGIDTERFQPADKASLRHQQGLPDGLLFGVFGRVEFKQKQQHFILRTMYESTGPLGKATVLFVGDGPDYQNLVTMVQDAGLTARVILRAWEKNPELLYPALDALIIPSRFEGVPLVMLEAAACGVPIIGADLDGMHDFLPSDWRYSFGDPHGLEIALNNALNQGPEGVDKQRQRVLRHHTLSQFEMRFVNTLLRELP